MSTNRAPRGIPTGGQFVASSRSEPSIGLDAGEAPAPLSGHLPGHSGGQPPSLRGPVKINGERVPEDRVHFDDGVPNRSPAPDPTSPVPHSIDDDHGQGQPGLRDVAEKVGDELVETVDAIAGLSRHRSRIRRGRTPAPETGGSFVGWDQMIPKFLRRKEHQGEPVSAEEAHLEAERQSRIKASEEARASLLRTIERMDSPEGRAARYPYS